MFALSNRPASPRWIVSAVRTLQRIDTFGPLPREYNGSYVSVEFWFDYRR